MNPKTPPVLISGPVGVGKSTVGHVYSSMLKIIALRTVLLILTTCMSFQIQLTH